MRASPDRTQLSDRTRRLLAHEGERSSALGALVVYGALSGIAAFAAFAADRSPVELEAGATWLPVSGIPAHALSVVGGSALAVATIAATRQFVARWQWARALHANLRPAVRRASESTIVVLGVASAVGEELFFRGLLTTSIGLVASSLAFGVLHQVRGQVRWFWAGWATVMGFLFGALFLATGSLLGAIVAHAAINVVNLRFLRDREFK